MFSLTRACKEYTMFVQIDNFGVIYKRYKKERRVSWDNIQRLEYRGINVKTLTPCMQIHVRGDPERIQVFDEIEELCIDYNFKHPKIIWQDIVENARRNNSNIIIDKEFLK